MRSLAITTSALLRTSREDGHQPSGTSRQLPPFSSADVQRKVCVDRSVVAEANLEQMTISRNVGTCESQMNERTVHERSTHSSQMNRKNCAQAPFSRPPDVKEL